MYHAKCASLSRVPKDAFICPAHESAPLLSTSGQAEKSPNKVSGKASLSESKSDCSNIIACATDAQVQLLSKAMGVDADHITNVSWRSILRFSFVLYLNDIHRFTRTQLIKDGMPVGSVSGELRHI